MILLTRRIQILPHQVAERIAAGEVIERPSSVVKELVENSIDAGATEIAVVLEDGGKAMIEVTDNGCGLHADDLPLCLKRHATSKLASLEDLERITTLGFRGEALPSIAAVADLAVLSRAQNAETAYELKIADLEPSSSQAAPATFGHFLGSSHGTRIQARGLFSQVPARLKFLKSQAAEVSQTREWIERLAIAHPGIGFRLISGDRSILQLRAANGTDGEAARVRGILAENGDYPVVSSDSGAGGALTGPLRVRLHWVQGLSTPQTRKLIQVVNGRAVRDRLLQQAMLSAFRQALLPGQFPALALFIEIDPALIDVNVHPTKTEIRFLDSRRAFQEVEKAARQLLDQHGAPARATGLGGLAQVSAGSVALAVSERLFSPGFDRPSLEGTGEKAPWPASASPDSGSFSGSRSSSSSWGASESRTPSWTVPPTEAVPRTPGALPDWLRGKYSGALFNTYLLYEGEEELVLIDQHAAHERIRYERLKNRLLSNTARGEQPHDLIQTLLLPEAVHFPSEQRAEVEARLPWLERLGFDCELFGEESLLFRGVPADWGTGNLRARLKGLLERLLVLAELDGGRNLLLDESLFERLASEACHSAIRAGDRLEPLEAQAVVSDLFRCENPWNCPHGRPTVVRVPRGRLEEWFQRRT